MSADSELDRAFGSLAALLEDAAQRPPILRVMESRMVTRTDWLHGLVRCPSCGLSLDAEKDLLDYIHKLGASQPVGVNGKHRRCGTLFTFTFDGGKR